MAKLRALRGSALRPRTGPRRGPVCGESRRVRRRGSPAPARPPERRLRAPRPAYGRAGPARPRDGQRVVHAAGGHHHPLDAEPGRLLEAAVGVGDVAQLAGEADLAEAAGGTAGPVERLLAGRRGDRQGDGQVGSRLLDADPAGDVHEHVRGAQRRAAVPGQHRKDHAQPVAVDAARDAAGRHDLGRGDQRLDLHEQRAGALHRAQHAGAGHRIGVAQEAVGRIGDLGQARRRASRTRRSRSWSRSGS